MDDRDIELLAFGESLVDFLPEQRGVPLRAVERFRKTVGGAPTNLALGLGRLGRRPGLHGKVGDDEFGAFVREELDDAGVDIRGVATTDEAKTGLTFVTVEEDGERSFVFYRDPSADMTLRAEDVDPGLVADSGVFHFGSNLLIEPGVRRATLAGLEAATSADCLVSVDPNIRLHLWPDEKTARQSVLELTDEADIFKLNDEELEIMAPGKSPDAVWEDILRPRGVGLFVVTLGADGAVGFSPSGRVEIEAPAVDVVDTTGAGDGFLSGFFARLLADLSGGGEWRERLGGLPEEVLEEALRLGCHVGSRVCTELGATPPLPTIDELPPNLREVLS